MLVTGRKISEYSAPPDREKNCAFVFPGDPRNDKFITLVIQPPARAIRLDERGGLINDASCLNRTPIYGVVKVQSVDDV